MTRKGPITLTLILFALVACAPESPEDQLVDAAEDVAEVQDRIENVSEEIADTRSELDVRRAAVRNAEQELASARSELRKLQRKLAKERTDLDNTASDTAIFRLLQTRLLDDDVLASEAINLFVLDGTVVLYGDVSSEEKKQRAADIAAEVPAVATVRNFIDVTGPSAQEKNAS